MTEHPHKSFSTWGPHPWHGLSIGPNPPEMVPTPRGLRPPVDELQRGCPGSRRGCWSPQPVNAIPPGDLERLVIGPCGPDCGSAFDVTGTTLRRSRSRK